MNDEEKDEPKRALGSMWEKLAGKRVVIQEKAPVIVIGTLARVEDGFVKLRDAKVQGRFFNAKPDRIWIDKRSIAHIHPECDTEKVTRETNRNAPLDEADEAQHLEQDGTANEAAQQGHSVSEEDG